MTAYEHATRMTLGQACERRANPTYRHGFFRDMVGSCQVIMSKETGPDMETPNTLSGECGEWGGSSLPSGLGGHGRRSSPSRVRGPGRKLKRFLCIFYPTKPNSVNKILLNVAKSRVT